MTSLLNFIQIYQLVQKLTEDRQTHRQDGDLISVYFSFRKESRPKIQVSCQHFSTGLVSLIMQLSFSRPVPGRSTTLCSVLCNRTIFLLFQLITLLSIPVAPVTCVTLSILDTVFFPIHVAIYIYSFH
jgi:hypothetical protein